MSDNSQLFFLEKRSIKIPALGFGTYKLRGRGGRLAMEEALRTGYRHIDTARYYENEEEVGKAIRASGISREEIFITTKIWPDDYGRLMDAAQQSLDKLNTDYIDLLLLHWPSSENADNKALDQLNTALE